MTIPPRRVVITGAGVVSPLGDDLGAFWAALLAGQSGIGPVIRHSEEWIEPQTGVPPQWSGAEVKTVDPDLLGITMSPAAIDRFAQFALVATQRALADAGPDFLEHNRHQTAVVLGTAVGGDTSRDEASFRLYKKQARISPLTIAKVMMNSAVSLISIAYSLTGPAYTVASACASSNHAIGQAFKLIQQGCVCAAITGGSETLPSYGLYKAWEQLRVLSPDTCRPFCRTRNGMVLGEGAGILVLESLESAIARDARIYAELVGFGMSADAADLVHPSSAGMAQAIHMALQDARLSPIDVDYVNAHGTGTLVNDRTEAQALQQVFGEHVLRLPVSSIKSMLGHALGASGAFECIATALALQHDLIPPTIHYTDPDPACQLDIVAHKPRAKRLEAALSNSFAFGGLNAVLALHKFS